MEPGEYEDLISKASTSNSAAIELLQSMRTNKIRQPELVIQHGGRLLKNCPGKLGDELWTLYEQVFLAALELGADEWRDFSIKKLLKRFPDSMRVERLKGMYKESLQEWAEAKKIYEGILVEKPEDTLAHKRLIAMHKQRGEPTEAIHAINTYLETFCTDADVWHELAELYIEVGSLQRATYCFEELILSNPRSMYHLLTYAELLYSTGDLQLSRKYYCLACHLDGECLRALWGLLLISAEIEKNEKDKQSAKISELQVFAGERIKNIYSSLGVTGKPALALLDAGFL